MSQVQPTLQTWSPQLCLSTLGCAELSFPETVALASQQKVGAIEIRCLSGETIEPSNFSAHFPASSAALAFLRANGVELSGLGTSVKLMDPMADDLETLVQFARLADELKCPWLRIFDGGTIGEAPTAKNLADATDLIRAWDSVRKKLRLNAQLMVETHDGLTSIAAITRFQKRLPKVAILWDTHHTWRAGESVTPYWTAAQQNIVHVHVKDSIDQPSPRKPFTYCLPGQGKFPWAELGQLLRKAAFAGKVSLEWERHWHPYLDPIDAALPRYREMLAQW